jgi:hypothetical protein
MKWPDVASIRGSRNAADRSCNFVNLMLTRFSKQIFPENSLFFTDSTRETQYRGRVKKLLLTHLSKTQCRSSRDEKVPADHGGFPTVSNSAKYENSKLSMRRAVRHSEPISNIISRILHRFDIARCKNPKIAKLCYN